MQPPRRIDCWHWFSSCVALWLSSNLPSLAEGRVAGKAGSGTNYYSGKSYSGINDEIIYLSIGMGVVIIVLIAMALCYIAHEECHKKREFYVTA